MEQKVVVITGASSGIGAATARKLGKMGVKVVLAARREEQLAALVREIGDNAFAVRTDVAVKSDHERLVAAALKKFGRIDIWWNNAGVMPLSFFDEGATADWDRMIDINIKGVLYGINAVLPHMLERVPSQYFCLLRHAERACEGRVCPGACALSCHRR